MPEPAVRCWYSFPPAHTFPGDGSDTTVEGILRPMNPVIARQLKERKYIHAGIPIDRRFMLVAGRQPGWLEGPLITGTVAGLLLLALAWSTFRRNVIFMPADSGLSGHAAAFLDAASSEPLQVSATLTLDGKTRRFFTHMPAVVHRMETGDTALLSHIETSSTYMGMKTDQHSGVWMLAIRPGSVTEAQAGYVFWGLKKMRATRFRYVSALSGASETAVVATAANSVQSLTQRTENARVFSPSR
jgi:hypothetical protein